MYFQAVQDVQISTRVSRAQFQYTLTGADPDDVSLWANRLAEKLQSLPIFHDVASEAQDQGLRMNVIIDRELAAYDAPFPTRIHMTGMRVFPSLIDTIGDEPTNEGARQVFNAWTKPFLTLFGRKDPNLGSEAIQAELRDTVPGAQGQPHHAYEDAGHFVQEDVGPDLAHRIDAFIRANPRPQS